MEFYIVNNEEVVLGDREAQEVLLNSRFSYNIELTVTTQTPTKQDFEDCDDYSEYGEQGDDEYEATLQFGYLDIDEFCEKVAKYDKKGCELEATIRFTDHTKNIGRYSDRSIIISADEGRIFDDIFETAWDLAKDAVEEGYYDYRPLTEWLSGITNKDTLLYVLHQVQSITPNKRLAKRIESLEKIDFGALEDDKIEFMVERFVALIEQIEAGLDN